MTRITKAEFLISAVNLAGCPEFGVSEVAFLGRSNVGKSSLINALTNRVNLAKSSSTPGKTRLINFFDVEFTYENEKSRAIFVDLPGFGYAKVAKSQHEDWKKNLDEFIKKRPYIRCFVHLIDSRHAFLDTDTNLGAYLRSFARTDQKILSLYTKSDKLNQSQKAAIKKVNSEAILVSSSKKSGVDEAVNAIYEGLFR